MLTAETQEKHLLLFLYFDLFCSWFWSFFLFFPPFLRYCDCCHYYYIHLCFWGFLFNYIFYFLCILQPLHWLFVVLWDLLLLLLLFSPPSSFFSFVLFFLLFFSWCSFSLLYIYIYKSFLCISIFFLLFVTMLVSHFCSLCFILQ